jgi:hypothetical protein
VQSSAVQCSPVQSSACSAVCELQCACSACECNGEAKCDRWPRTFRSNVLLVANSLDIWVGLECGVVEQNLHRVDTMRVSARATEVVRGGGGGGNTRICLA